VPTTHSQERTHIGGLAISLTGRPSLVLSCEDRGWGSLSRLKMAMTAHAQYKALIANASDSLDHLVADKPRLSAFTAAHNYSADFETLVSVVRPRPEAAVLDLAVKEFHQSLYASASGSYRHAHISLRLFFELFCAGVLFSAYEIKLRSWLSSLEGSDIIWSTIVSPDNGIFSVNFLRAFNPDISEYGKQYLTIATKTYRECSEFVHGNFSTHKQDANPPLTYNGDIIDAWLERAEAVRLCVVFSFAGRYLRLLDKDAQTKVESIMLDNFGHLGAVQTIYA
jgi:hypothetical protein